MAELEEELIGDDLDYEYDLDEEEEEALLAGDGPSHEVEDIIELRVEDDFGEQDDGGQIAHSKSIHSRLQPPNRLQASGRLQPPNTVYEEDKLPQHRLQTSGRLQPSNTVYEEELQPQNRLQTSGRLQPANTVYEEEEIQETYDTSINDEPVPVHIQMETQNIIEEEEEEEEEDDGDGEDGRGRDRFKSERSKVSLGNTTVKRIIPDSLDQVQVKEQLNQQKAQRGRGRGRGSPIQQRGGMMRGGQRGGMRGGMMPPGYGGWQGPPRSGAPHWQQSQQQPPLMMNPPSRMTPYGSSLSQGSRGGLHGMGQPSIYSLFGPGPPSQRQNQPRSSNPGNYSLMGSVPWSAGVGPYNPPPPGILGHLIPRPQIPPPDDMRNMIKKRSMNDSMTGQPSKQMKLNQGPANNQHQHHSPQHGGMRSHIASRLSMPSPNANPNLTNVQTASSNVNPNLTTIQTVDINSVQQNQQNRAPMAQQNNMAKPQMNPNQNQALKPQVNQSQQKQGKPLQKSQPQPNQAVAQQKQESTVQQNQNNETKVPLKPTKPLSPEEMEYQKKLQQQKKLREEMLAKKEARRKAAAQVKVSELAKKKGGDEKSKPSAAAPPQNTSNQQQKPAAPTNQPQNVQKGPHVLY